MSECFNVAPNLYHALPLLYTRHLVMLLHRTTLNPSIPPNLQISVSDGYSLKELENVTRVATVKFSTATCYRLDIKGKIDWRQTVQMRKRNLFFSKLFIYIYYNKVYVAHFLKCNSTNIWNASG